MQVRDIMTTDLVTARPDDKVSDVAQKIIDRHISGVFVVDGDKLLGKVSHKDILQHVFPTYEEYYQDMVHSADFEAIRARANDLNQHRAVEVMSEDVLTVGPDEPIMKIAAWMILKRVHRLAVVDESGQLLGVVSRGDVFYHTLGNEVKTAAR